jgi:isopenicillin N synthase-like dioxygenase
MDQLVPVIDLASYYISEPGSHEARQIAQLLHEAAAQWGFFLVTGTSVCLETQSSLFSASRAFFELPEEAKLALDVRAGGPAWRGYMPLGGEHTHGRLDWKEGLYIGPEHAETHPLFGLPLHGKNQFPDQVFPEMRHIVLDYVNQVTELGKTLTDIFSPALGVDLGPKLLEPAPVVFSDVSNTHL